MTNYEQINVQEQKDFNITNKIMTQIFQTYGAKAKLDQMPPFSPYDAKMKVTKSKIEKHYTVEIKERNVPCLEDLESLPLKVKKYCNIKKHSEGKTPLVIYLVNGKKYYIYDLNKIEIKNWNIPKVQYSDKHEYEEQPIFKFPLNQSIYNGTFAYANNQ